jgi:hypothetical protein
MKSIPDTVTKISPRLSITILVVFGIAFMAIIWFGYQSMIIAAERACTLSIEAAISKQLINDSVLSDRLHLNEVPRRLSDKEVDEIFREISKTQSLDCSSFPSQKHGKFGDDSYLPIIVWKEKGRVLVRITN